MDWLRALLETSPLTALFLTIAAGYLVGEINLKGFALGSGAVLFVGLACGAFAPKSAPPGLLGTLGLLLFLYCVGIQYGAEWFRGLTSPEGLKANFAGLCGLTAAERGLTARFIGSGAASLPQALGMFAGSGTSTPALQAILDAFHEPGRRGRLQRDLSVWRRRADPVHVPLPGASSSRGSRPRRPAIQPAEVSVRNAGAGPAVPSPSCSRRLPDGVQVVAIRDSAAEPRSHPVDDRSRPDDVLLIVGTDAATDRRGAPVDWRSDAGRARGRPDRLDYVRVYASRRSVVGMPLRSLKIPGGFEYSYIQVRRGDTDLLPDDDLVLEFGDRVGVLCSRANFPAVRSFYGDSVKGCGRLQLRLDRRRRGDGPGRRVDSASGSRRRPDDAGAGRRAARRPRAGQGAPHVRHRLDAAAVGEPRAAKLRADGLPGAGRDRVRAPVRRDDRRDRLDVRRCLAP